MEYVQEGLLRFLKTDTICHIYDVKLCLLVYTCEN